MATNLPRGIRVMKWRNADGSKSVRYRVRVERADFQVDRLFDNDDLAVLFLQDTKTEQGRKAIRNGTDQASVKRSEIEKLAQDWIVNNRCTLSTAIDNYIRDYIKPKLDAPLDKDRLTAKAILPRLHKMKSVKVGRVKPGFIEPTGQLAALRKFAKGFEMIEIGSVFIDELTPQMTTEYIRARLADGKAKSTVVREVAQLRSVINKLAFTDPRAFAKLDGRNAFANADMSLLKGGTVRRRRIISDEEEGALLQELAKHRNPEMLYAFCLAISTGMRRGEMLSLTWDRVDLERGVIYLDADLTKAADERVAILTDEAVELLKRMPKDDERLFHYTIEGFKSNFKRLLERVGLGDLRMHDTRRTFVSRVLKEISSPVAIADMIGAKNVKNLADGMIKRIEEQRLIDERKVRTEEGLRFVVGHKDAQVTARYAVMADTNRTKKKGVSQ